MSGKQTISEGIGHDFGTFSALTHLPAVNGIGKSENVESHINNLTRNEMSDRPNLTNHQLIPDPPLLSDFILISSPNLITFFPAFPFYAQPSFDFNQTSTPRSFPWVNIVFCFSSNKQTEKNTLIIFKIHIVNDYTFSFVDSEYCS